MTGYIIIATLIVSGTLIHFRGKRRFGFFRKLFDHSTFMAPINLLMYHFSKVSNTPYLELDEIPELRNVTDNWEVIRKEAFGLDENKRIKQRSFF